MGDQKKISRVDSSSNSNSSGSVNRLKELDKLWFRLRMPRQGDKIRFRIKGSNKEFDGRIIVAKKEGKLTQYRYQIKSSHAPRGDEEIEIIECNGIRFGRVDKTYDQINQGYSPV